MLAIDASAFQAASQAEMEAVAINSKGATPLNMKWHPGVAKVWCRWNGTGTTILASLNVSSLTNTGTGDETVNYTTSMSSTNYAAFGFGNDTPGNVNRMASPHTYSTGSFRITGGDGVGTQLDMTLLSFVAFGDF